MRHLLFRSKQERWKNLYRRLSLLVMLISSHTLILAPKPVVMFLIPKTKILQRIGLTRQRSYISTVTSRNTLLYDRNHKYPMASLRMSLLSTSSDDSDTNNIATSTTDANEKSPAELEAVQAAREARKYV